MLQRYSHTNEKAKQCTINRLEARISNELRNKISNADNVLQVME